MIKLDHLTILVRNPAAASAWYTQKLGLKVEFEVPQRAVAMQDDSGFTLFLEQAGGDAALPSCVMYFQVDDVDATYDRLDADQTSFVHVPQKRFWGYGAELKDLDGYRIRLWDQRSMNEKGD